MGRIGGPELVSTDSVNLSNVIKLLRSNGCDSVCVCVRE